MIKLLVVAVAALCLSSVRALAADDAAAPATQPATRPAAAAAAVKDFRSVVPIFNVRSMPVSLAYYVDKLGFTKQWDWGTPIEFASIKRGDVEIFLCQGAQGQAGMWLHLMVADVDKLFEEYQESGAVIVQAPTNFPWGVREMNVSDPDGHRLRIGSETKAKPEGVPLKED